MHFFTLSKSVGGSGNVNTEKQTVDQTNSISYSAMYLEKKLNLDQNENVSCLRLTLSCCGWVYWNDVATSK